MKNIIRNLIVGTGILVLFTHTVSAQWVQIDSSRFKCFPEMCLAVSGGNLFAGTAFAVTTGSGVFISTDNGTSWTDALRVYAVYSLAVSGSSIFAGTWRGVFRSTDNGTSWTAVDSGLPANISVYSLAVSGSNIFAGTDSGHVFLSTNNGTRWTKADSGIPANSGVSSLAASGSNIFARTVSGVYHSSNNGATWTAVGSNSGLPASIGRLAASGNNIFAGGNGVYRSSDFGATWTAVNSGLTYKSAYSLAVSGSNIFAGTDSGHVFLSTDSGTSWADCNSGLSLGLPGWDVDGLAVGESYIFASLTASAMHWIFRRPLSEIVGIINGKPQQGMVKPYAGGFKINISKNGITVVLPENLNNGAITVGLFTIAGKRIYSATHQAYNGILNIQVSGLSTGTYLMSIRGNNTTLSSPFVVTK
jgi:hypothetical protein